MIYNAVNLMSDELHTYRFLPGWLSKVLAAVLDWFVPIFPDHIMAVTPELCEGLRQRGVSPDRLSLVPCGIRPEMFEGANPEKFREQHGIGRRPVVLYTGINNAFQRVDYLLRAFTLVRRQSSDAVLMIVSPIPHEPDRFVNEELGHQLGLGDSVRWIGPHTLEELKDYLALATVCVVPRPDCPGHPIKLLNYMTAARPIVCFTSAGKGVTHLHDALLVADHDWQQMGEAIGRLLREPDLAARLAANARATALQNFDWRMLCRTVVSVYDRLAPGAAARKATKADGAASSQSVVQPPAAS
jgi:glycosyltransferase involved in cell wall biosynthesis